MNILLAEDEATLGELVVYMLKKKAGYKVEWVLDGEDAYYYAASSHYDVIIMDWMMPNATGVDVCRKLRKQGYSGADDYLIKPFEIDELLARLRALSRRNYAPILEEEVMIQELVLNRMSNTVRLGSDYVQLSPREFQLFDLLVQNKGQVIPREVILERIWGFDSDVALKTIDATIKLIRKKLQLFSKQDLLHSIRGVGYKVD